MLGCGQIHLWFAQCEIHFMQSLRAYAAFDHQNTLATIIHPEHMLIMEIALDNTKDTLRRNVPLHRPH